MSFDREKQRKAGRNMSIAASAFALGFSIVWCFMAAAMGAWFMLIFGIPFACLMGYRLVMCIKLAKSENGRNAADPWDRPAGQQSYQQTPPWQEPPVSGGSGYCPYCGASTQEGFQFCPTCGRKLPQ